MKLHELCLGKALIAIDIVHRGRMYPRTVALIDDRRFNFYTNLERGDLEAHLKAVEACGFAEQDVAFSMETYDVNGRPTRGAYAMYFHESIIEAQRAAFQKTIGPYFKAKWAHISL